MKIAVITCQKYSDAWAPFRALLTHYWPDCPYPVEFWPDEPGESWCSVVIRCAKSTSEPILLMLEDFFLTAPVQTELVKRGLLLLLASGAGCVRLYPSPGANGHSVDVDRYFGIVTHGTPHRISCQAAIWDPRYLHDVTLHSMTTTSEAGDFENLGTPYADTLTTPVLAFHRSMEPWPMTYLCSAISRGLWDPNALKLCERLGIQMDLSLRPVSVQ